MIQLEDAGGHSLYLLVFARPGVTKFRTEVGQDQKLRCGVVDGLV